MIKTLELRRFKKFEHTTIELGELSILVGENSSGKTTILQAINLALHAFSRMKLYSTTNEVATPRRKGVGCRELPGILNSDFRELYYAKKSRSSRSGSGTNGAELYLTDDKANCFGLQISSLFGGYNITPLSKASQITNSPEIHQKEALLISGFVGLSSSEEKTLSLSLRNRLRDGRASEIIRNLLLDTKESVPENYALLVQRLEKDFGFIIDDVAFNEQEDINVHAYYDERINSTKIPFDFCASGSGMMQVLQILTSIYRYCPSSSTVVLLDEPDAHLHANMQVALFHSLQEIQKELGIQIIISTHSTAIISAASPSEIIPVSNATHIKALAEIEEVEEVITERIDSYELSKIKTNGVLVFFEDQNIEYLLRCDQVLKTHCLIGPRTVSYLTGRTKDDKLPFSIKPVLKEILGKDISIFVIRDRDGLSSDVTDVMVTLAEKAKIHYHFLENYEIESYMLSPELIHRTLSRMNPGKAIPTVDEVKTQLSSYLLDTIQLARYSYTTVLEDCLSKMSCFSGLEQYRGSNEYRAKAVEIRTAHESLTAFDDLRKEGMGKETLKRLLAWLNEDKKLKISRKGLISDIRVEDIPDEIRTFFEEIKKAMI